jgi:hypothetical protein
MLLHMIIKLAPLKRTLSDFILVLMRRHRVLSDRVPMSVLDGFRCFQTLLFLVLVDFRCVAVGCGPGGCRREIVVLVCEAGDCGGGDERPGPKLVRASKWKMDRGRDLPC